MLLSESFLPQEWTLKPSRHWGEGATAFTQKMLHKKQTRVGYDSGNTQIGDNPRKI